MVFSKEFAYIKSKANMFNRLQYVQSRLPILFMILSPRLRVSESLFDLWYLKLWNRFFFSSIDTFRVWY